MSVIVNPGGGGTGGGLIVIDNFVGLNLYVDVNTGNDANNGLTAPTAFKTIQRAVDVAVTQYIFKPQSFGVTVNIADGTYNESVFGNAIPAIPNIYFTGNFADWSKVQWTAQAGLACFYGNNGFWGFNYISFTCTAANTGAIAMISPDAYAYVDSVNFLGCSCNGCVRAGSAGEGAGGQITLGSCHVFGTNTILCFAQAHGYIENSHGTVTLEAGATFTNTIYRADRYGTIESEAGNNLNFVNTGAYAGSQYVCSNNSRIQFKDITGVPGSGGTVDASSLVNNYGTGATQAVPFKTPVTFAGLANLPSPLEEGMLVPVSDANKNVWGEIITAGGAGNHVLAYWDGTNWSVAAATDANLLYDQQPAPLTDTDPGTPYRVAFDGIGNMFVCYAANKWAKFSNVAPFGVNRITQAGDNRISQAGDQRVTWNP
jgi:hypothetical protein